MAIELENSTPPEWMIALENKKRHHKLAHEIGAGAPCLNCSDRCSGLDLHFWRKICRNCKCKKEVHDVKEENNFEQFEILFGDKVGCNDRVKKISLDLGGKLNDIFSARETSTGDSNSPNDLSFDWIPTDVPANLATEYLQQLPLDKLPITGSAGAMFRRQQLQKQMPLHDFKVNNCHELTDEESQAFSQYVDNLRNNAVGMGQITKISASVTNTNEDIFTSKTPLAINNLNSTPKPFKSFSETKPPADKDNLSSRPIDLTFSSVDLKTPSAFHPYKKFNPKCASKNINETGDNTSGSSDHVEITPVDDLTERCYQQLTVNNELDTRNNNIVPTSEGNLTPRDIIRILNAQQADVKKELIKSPDVFYEQSRSYSPKYDSLSSSNDHSSHHESNAVKNVDVKLSKVGNPEQFMAVSSYVPKKPQLSNRLTSTLDRNRNIEEIRSNSPSNNAFLVKRSVATCHQCKITVHQGQIVVVAERAGVEVVWHPQCFVCVLCKELLVDLVYFFHRGEVYCGRHFAEILQIPRCFACDELIFVKEYTVAENQTFHVKHFCCFECDIPLADKQYIPKDDNPVCLPCYETKYGKKCHHCGKSIKAGDQRIGWDNFSWHALATCFKCVQCSKSLLNCKFVMRNKNPLCSKECITEYESKLR